MNSITNYKCRICSGATYPIQTENRHDKEYNVVCCRNCKTIQTIEHMDVVSPDYVELTVETLSHAHIHQSREHKLAAYSQFIKLFKYKLKSKTNIVDVGCGTAGFGEFVENLKFSYYGFDASSAQISYAKSKNLNVVLATTCGDFLSQDIIKPDQVDIVTMWDVLEHVRDPKGFMADVKNLMNPNSYLFISVPNGGAYKWKRLASRLMHRKISFDPWEHVFYYNIESLNMLLQECGFSIVKTGSVVCYPRKFDIKEALRRFAFKFVSISPSIAPQIYAIAKHSKSS